MPSRFVSWLKSSRNTGALYSFFLPATFLLCLALLLSTIFVGKYNTEKSVKWVGIDSIRGSRYPKTSEVSPQPSTVRPHLSPQLPPQPPQQQPSLQPQPPSLEKQPPSPQPQPQPEQQPPSLQPQPPQPDKQPPSPQPQPPQPEQKPPSPQPQPPQPEQQPPSPQPQPPQQDKQPPSPQPQPPQPEQQPPSPQPDKQPPSLQPQPPQPEQQPPSLQPQPPQPEQQPPSLQPQPPPPDQQPPSPQPPTQQPSSPQLQPQSESPIPPSPSPSPQLQPERQTQSSPEPQPPQGDQKYLPQNQFRPPGSEALPRGLSANTSDLQMQPLYGRRKKVHSSTSLFTAAVGIKQKQTVDRMVRKFLSSDFSVMLFHYDGVVDAWRDLDWSDNVIHVSAVNQTKWWFAKRFLHPDIVAAYSYIFLWDEDLGVDNFDPGRYLSIVKAEGLEISQPALDSKKSEVHHLITSRWRNSTVHRRVKPSANNKIACDPTSQYPPCTGWIELMAPVFSKAAWRCMWYMIQNDLNHAWGLDIMFGYCAQGDRTKNVGVVDAEYIVHLAFPTFGDTQSKEKPSNSSATNATTSNARIEVRKHSHQEYKMFKRRWQAAAKEDVEWVDPYPESWNCSIL